MLEKYKQQAILLQSICFSMANQIIAFFNWSNSKGYFGLATALTEIPFWKLNFWLNSKEIVAI